MSGDYSRKRFNPENHFQGVLRQQGRVDLDADWNEYIDIQDRRWRAETIDVIGRCGVPAETPDGFNIQGPIANLTIGQGRIYVDGFLAENHGANLLFNLTLEEKYGTAPLPLNDQPYGANPLTVPENVRSLVYVDVWRREVTPLQDAKLIEPAVNVDTTTRYQTAWQVKILADIASSVDCQMELTDIPNWPSANLPSTARLTTATVAVTAEPDPCLVPPSGGYRGLDNHLYRVEVHDVTNTGVRVKWSRENAHVASNIMEILPGRTGVKVASLGRDDALRFKTGDWVEFTSDRREFLGAAGFMRKVTVDTTNQTITFSTALPAADFPEGPADADHHPRAIRWDQAKSVRKPDGTELANLDFTTDGLIELTAANPSFVLEHGVQATLTILAGGTAHAGDYWCFAARTADADIEHLNAAAPFGIHHHFCKLAIIEVGGSIDDCRPVFDPLTELKPGCCTVVVRPGEDIQAALDSLPADGGCVCLKVGVHEITTPIRIENSNVSLHGETLGARVVRKNGAALLSIGDSGGLLLEHVTVSEMCFEFQNKGAQGGGLPALIAIDRCRNTKVDGCVIRAEQSGNFTGVQIGRSADIEVSHCQIENVRYGAWVVSDSTFIHIAGNLLHSTLNKNSDGGIAGVFLMDAFGPSTVEDNRITGFIFGIAINKGLLTGTPLSLANGSRITANRILRLDAESESGNVKASGIDVAANDCLIADNIVAYTAEAYGGIAASGGNAIVERNLVRSLAREASASPSIGILLGRLSAQGSLPSSGGRVAANNVLGAQDGIVLIGNTAAQVLDNRVESEGNEARFAIALSATSRACVNGNRITGAALPLVAIQGTANEFSDNTLLRGGGGATLVNQTSLEFSRNRVEDMRNYG
ncbi:MAG TPA: DUF6519 domain-containing protein, partial [Candidatus Binatia bacterium]